MTHGHGPSPTGWSPPPNSRSRPSAHRQAPSEEQAPPSGYEERAFLAPPAPPVHEVPARPRRSDAGGGALTDRYVPRRAARPEAPPSHPQPGHPEQGYPDQSRREQGYPDQSRREQSHPEPPAAHLVPAPRGVGTVRVGPPLPVPAPPPAAVPPGIAPPAPAPPGSAPAPTQTPPTPHRAVEPGRRPRRPRIALSSPAWTALGAMAITILAGVVGIAGYIVVTHHGAAASPLSAASPAARPKPRDISNRQVDPVALSQAEVFPGPTLNPSGYRVLKAVALPDCTTVAVGQPVQALSDAGCSQGVLATVTSADQAYVATVGLLNLATETGAEQVSTALHGAVGPQKGRLTGYDAGGASVILLKAPTQLGWDVRGHFLGYCVVARVDGKPLDGTDAGARKVIDDLVEKYLVGTVLQGRVTPSPSPTPPPASAPAAKKSGK